MATHSSVLAWRMPGMGEPGGLPSMGSQSQTRLKRLSSSSSNHILDILKSLPTNICHFCVCFYWWFFFLFARLVVHCVCVCLCMNAWKQIRTHLLWKLWRRQWHPTPVLLPGKPPGRRSLVGCSPWGREKSDTTERLCFHFSLSCIGEGNGNPLKCSCLENPRGGRACWAAVYVVTQSRTRLKWLSSSMNIISSNL